MKVKYVTMGLLAGAMCLGLGSAMAEEAEPVAASLDLPVLSAYVWRGQVLTDEAVVQPSLTVSKNGFSINAWANYNAAGSYCGDNEKKFSEMDLTASYSYSVGPATLGLGIAQYTFPNQTLETETGGVAYPETSEAFASIGLDIPLAPTLTVYRDLDSIEGFYAMLGVSHSFTLCDQASLVASASVGAGDKDYNTGYFGEDKDAMNDVNVGLALPITVLENLTIKPAVSYTYLPDSSISDAAEAVYGDDSHFVGSVTASYTF